MDGFKRRLKESVQLRLTVALCLAIALVASVAGLFAYYYAFDEAHDLQDDALRQVAVLFDRQQMTLTYPTSGRVEGDDEESRIIVQYLADGGMASGAGEGDHGTPLPLPANLRDGLQTLVLGNEDFRVLVRTTARGERIAVAQEVGARDLSARQSALRSLVPFLMLFPVLLLVVGDLLRKLFRPIATLSSEIDRRSEQDLHPLNERHVPSEVRPFVVAINRLLARVATAMHSQGRFVADAAHELRSPLTALSLQAERLAAAPMSEQAGQRLLTLRRGIERARQLIDQMLALTRARATSAQPLNASQPLSINAIFRRVLEDLLPLAERKNIDLGVESTDDILVACAEFDLLVLVKNLLDNAIRYTSEGGRVDLWVASAPGQVLLQVRDNGPGIPPAERERVFDPFYRGLAAGRQASGSGLGLAIVSAIAERLGATVRLDYTDPYNERGLCVSVALQTPNQTASLPLARKLL